MPPRTPACRSAVQHATLRQSRPIWITDDVLADAFHRYVNVSNASRKRYGSNVPGPLEARRRASKRRIMGFTAASSSVGPDLGALFGSEKPNLQAWTWEAPKSVELPLTRDKARSATLPKWLSDFDKTTDDHPPQVMDPLQTYQIRLAAVRDTHDLENLWSQIGIEPQNMVVFSSMANTHFLDNLDAPGMGYRALFDFLRNPKVNISEAQNMKHFIGWAKTKGIPIDCLGELINRIWDSLRLGIMSQSELHAIMDDIPQLCAKSCKGDAKAVNNWLFEAYWAIWRGLASCKTFSVEKVNHDIIRKMADGLLGLGDPPRSFDTEDLVKTNPTSHTDPALFRLEIYGRRWPVVNGADRQDFVAYCVSWTQILVKNNLQESQYTQDGLGLSVLKTLMNSMHPRTAQKVMAGTVSTLLQTTQNNTHGDNTRRFLSFWFDIVSQTRHCHLDLFAADPALALRIDPVLAIPHLKILSVDTICQRWMRYWLPQYVAEDGQVRTWEKVQKRVRRFHDEQRRLVRKGEIRRSALFFNAILALKAEGLPYGTALFKAVEFTFALYGPFVAHHLCKRAFDEGLAIKDPRPFAAAIEAIADTHPMQALKYFKSSSEIPLSLCPKLPLALIAHDSLPRDELFALLERRGCSSIRTTPPPSQPPACEDATHDHHHHHHHHHRLSSHQTDLLHLIAYAYANQTARPTRQRFRNVYYCYLYLRDHHARLFPLLTKALVRATVTAPLENYEWVSTTKLRWVLRLVRAVEGPAVADQLDRLVWRWRGAVIAEARRRWDRAGFFRTRGPSTVTMVRAEGLFEGDYPKRRRRVVRKIVVGGRFVGPRFLRRVRFSKGRKEVWGRLPRRDGGKDGARNLGGRWKGFSGSLY